MNVRRYIWASVALFVFFFLYDWLVHGAILSPIYRMSPEVWRPVAEMRENMYYSLIYKVVTAFWITFVFTQLYKAGGVRNGVTFGLFFGVWAGLLMSNWYLWIPVAQILAWGWLVAGIVGGVVGGLIIGSIYQTGKRSK